MSITVSMTKEQWAHVIRLMHDGISEGLYYVGKDKEDELVLSEIYKQSGINFKEANDMEHERNYYVPKG